MIMMMIMFRCFLTDKANYIGWMLRQFQLKRGRSQHEDWEVTVCHDDMRNRWKKGDDGSLWSCNILFIDSSKGESESERVTEKLERWHALWSRKE